jgi:hypothetical protein
VTDTPRSLSDKEFDAAVKGTLDQSKLRADPQVADPTQSGIGSAVRAVGSHAADHNTVIDGTPDGTPRATYTSAAIGRDSSAAGSRSHALPSVRTEITGIASTIPGISAADGSTAGAVSRTRLPGSWDPKRSLAGQKLSLVAEDGSGIGKPVAEKDAIRNIINSGRNAVVFDSPVDVSTTNKFWTVEQVAAMNMYQNYLAANTHVLTANLSADSNPYELIHDVQVVNVPTSREEIGHTEAGRRMPIEAVSKNIGAFVTFYDPWHVDRTRARIAQLDATRGVDADRAQVVVIIPNMRQHQESGSRVDLDLLRTGVDVVVTYDVDSARRIGKALSGSTVRTVLMPPPKLRDVMNFAQLSDRQMTPGAAAAMQTMFNLTTQESRELAAEMRPSLVPGHGIDMEAEIQRDLAPGQAVGDYLEQEIRREAYERGLI